MQFHKVKITQPGWETFSGDYVGYPFKDGVSEVVIPRNIVDRIAALVQSEIFDDAGESLGQGGAAARIASRMSVDITIGTLQRQTEEAKAAELLKVHADGGVPPTREFYTEEQLTNVASLEGIDGLRKLAEPWSVKDRSIPKLIARIIKAQNDFIAGKQKKEEDERAARAAALDEATKQRLAEEAEMLKKARVLTQDETPNAVDADGKPVYVKPEAQKTEPPKNELEVKPEDQPNDNQPEGDEPKGDGEQG